MPRSQINGNFIDKTFSIVANINSFCSVSSINVTSDAIVDLSIERKVTPMGLYSMRLEIDPYDRSYILYNIGLIHTSNRKHTKALEYYF
ncbi:hypothetical protein ES319_A01G107800v1 [Gossypium barbadense]|uniref:Uncharacterized protein n=1 Tax=Gossypium barbadense TaxID=3634 RepID=A0A5J5WYJ9_GOSBA|nr:hypothetical protein ES319_A01G107800v1 [Gossypium barbadense]